MKELRDTIRRLRLEGAGAAEAEVRANLYIRSLFPVY
jgi:hypothetical protein